MGVKNVVSLWSTLCVIYTNMTKRILISLLVFVIALISILFIRFVLGGDEDTWLCENNAWVKHGNPSNSMPVEECISE